MGARKEKKYRKQVTVFKEIFGFLMSSQTLKLLNGTKLKECCTVLAVTFSHEVIFDVELNDLISELSIMQFTLPERPMSAIKIFESIIEVDCYPNTSIAYRILFTMP